MTVLRNFNTNIKNDKKFFHGISTEIMKMTAQRMKILPFSECLRSVEKHRRGEIQSFFGITNQFRLIDCKFNKYLYQSVIS